jgi:hypothetical protein
MKVLPLDSLPRCRVGYRSSLLPLVHIMKYGKILLLIAVFSLMSWTVAGTASGQSSDQSLPTAVLSNEISGEISALDMGDPRLTRRFYAFEGTPGDLLITIESKNLNGDLDIFTAVTFRPLMKTSLYASSQPSEVTKGLYLRTRQILILRVEARTPNDEVGSYHIRFGGSFEPFSGGIAVAENTGTEDDSARAGRGGKRLSSVGATMLEPAVEKPAVATTPEGKEKSAEETEAAKKSKAAKSAKARSARSRANARNSRPRPARPKPATTTTDSEAIKVSPAKTEETKKSVASGEEKTAAASSVKAEAPAKPSTQESPLPGPHLIIESKDGTKIDRPMSTVRRVVVEGGVIVIVLRTGHIERIPMSTVARMAIEP